MPAPGGRRPQDPKGRAGKAKGEGGMFFGASPTEREDLRETKDAKKLKLSDLNLNAAIDRDSLNAPEKVGDNLRLIDMAMGVDAFTPDKKTQAKQRHATKQTSEERARGGPTGPRRPRPGGPAGRAPAPRPGSPRPGGPRPSAGPGAPRPSAPRPGAPRSGGPRPGAPRPGAPRSGAPRPGAPRPGAPRPGAPRPGAPRPGAPRPGAPRPPQGPGGRPPRPGGAPPTRSGKPRPGSGPQRPKGPRKPR